MRTLTYLPITIPLGLVLNWASLWLIGLASLIRSPPKPWNRNRVLQVAVIWTRSNLHAARVRRQPLQWLLAPSLGGLLLIRCAWQQCRRCHIQLDRTGTVVAVCEVTTTDASWRLQNVAAWPPGCGAGRELVRTIGLQADEVGADIRLRVAHRSLVAFYGRLGFDVIAQGRRPAMRRAARSVKTRDAAVSS
jgi:hypothetical protein